MKWRTALGVLAALLLSLPLTWLLGTALRPELRAGRPLVPMLDFSVRRRMATYGHGCALDSECEAPLRCVLDTRVDRSFCADSECMSDAQCEPGYVCRTVVTHA